LNVKLEEIIEKLQYITSRSKIIAKYMNRLKGKTAVVTGIGAGIGQGIALMFAREGAEVFGSDINEKAAQATTNQAKSEGYIMEYLQGDLTDEVQVDALMKKAIETFGKIDILINAAAFCDFKLIEELDYQTHWKRSIAGELDIVFLACQKAWKYLKINGGSIVNFASANVRQSLKGSPALVHCATKGAVYSMSIQMASEGGQFGIRVNTISPALVHTAATDHLVQDPEFFDFLKSKHMVGRIGKPEDIAYCALYLASDESTWVTAADFPIDGGASKW
jgi:NAD(P)-dependent dehydrogenase (short-subunit alcohol dehydrogenase family)